MKKEIWKKWLNGLFLLLVFGVTLWTVFHGEDLKQVGLFLKTADKAWLVPAVLCVLLFIMGEAAVIFYMMRTMGVRVRFLRCCTYSFVGFFYSCVTPSASGGQPMQVMTMRKDGVPVAVSTVVLAIVTVTYKLVLVAMGLAVLLIRPQRLMDYLEPALPIVYLGLALNVVCVGALLLLVFDPGLVRKMARWLFRLLDKIRPFRNRQRQEERLERIMGQYEGAAEFYRGNKHVIVHVFLITLLQRCVLFLVTWFTYRSFHLFGHSLPEVLALQSMISVAADMMPLPGGMGISENMFLEIFQPVFGETLVLPGMVISRGISYYTQLLLSGVMTLVATFRPKKREKGK